MIGRVVAILRRWYRTLAPGEAALSERTIKGGVWVMLINVTDRVLQLAMVVFVAGLIGPEEFGLMGIALLVVSALRRLTELGVDASLVQHEDSDVDRYLNTAWTLKIGRGVGLFVIVLVCAPAIALLFGEWEAETVIRAIGLSILVQSLANPGLLYLQKNLEFHKEFVYKLSGRLTYVVIAVGYALHFHSVWALVLGHIAGTTVRTTMSYVVHDYRPRLAFDRGLATEMMTYGKWVFGSSILGFLGNEGDDVFVSWALGAASLGIYQMGYRISNAPATEITHTISRVVFPTYASLQHDTDALRRGYLSALQLIAFVSFPMAVGIALAIPSFTGVFLGADWSPMVLPAQLLAIYGLLHSFRTAAVPLFRAVGRPDFDTKIRALKLAFIVVLIYPASQLYGLVGVSLVIVGNAAVANPATHYLALRLVEGKPTELLALFAYPALGTTVMALCVIGAERGVDASPAVMLALTVIVGVVAYSASMLLVERVFDYDMIGLARTIRESIA